MCGPWLVSTVWTMAGCLCLKAVVILLGSCAGLQAYGEGGQLNFDVQIKAQLQDQTTTATSQDVVPPLPPLQLQLQLLPPDTVTILIIFGAVQVLIIEVSLLVICLRRHRDKRGARYHSLEEQRNEESSP